MKSYLRFLSRNKLYTAIEVVGLSIALAFVIILGAVLIDKSQVNDNIKDADEIYSMYVDTDWIGSISGTSCNMDEILPTIPQVREWCQFYDALQLCLKTEKNDSLLVAPMYVTPNYFTFFGFELTSGRASDALQANDAVVLSRKVADELFPHEDPIGKTISLPMTGDLSGAFLATEIPDKKDYIAYRITGVIDGLGKCVLPEGDIYLKAVSNSMRRKECMFRTDSPDNIDAILRSIRSYPAADEYDRRSLQELGIMPFEDIKDGEIDCPRYRHISDPVLFKMFVLICIVILAFSLLNYISLTLAFSRFRLKEAATRSLLGTSRAETFIRGIAEAFILVISSYILAIVLVLALKTELPSLLSVNIDPLGSGSVFAATFITAFVTALIAGGVNALMNRRYRPIDVIRGESRYQDKSYIGKIFIGIQSAICLATVVVGMVISMQTRKMTDYPVGYNTHNIISVMGDDYKKYIGELSQMHFVEKVGIASNSFVRYVYPQELKGVNWVPLRMDQNAFDMLGIKVKEYLELSGVSLQNAYTTEKGLQLAASLNMSAWENKYIGILEDVHFGSVKEISSENTIFDIVIKDDYSQYFKGNILIKVSGDQDEAKEQIRKFFMEKGEDTPQLTIQTLEEANLLNYEEESKLMRLVAVFSLISILLTALAIIALSSYYEQISTHDTAVRKVFGVSRKRIFWSTVWGFIYPVLIGAAVALPVSYFYMERWLQNYLVRIDNSLTIYFGALALVLVVTMSAVIIQSLRLMRTNPAEALKKE